MADSPEHANLTTRGRASGRPHTVELWYWDDGDRIWFLAGLDPPIVDGRPDWLQNLVAEPHVIVRIGDRVIDGTAAVLGEAGGDDARRGIARRYLGWRAGNPLPRWQRYGIAVAVTPR